MIRSHVVHSNSNGIFVAVKLQLLTNSRLRSIMPKIRDYIQKKNQKHCRGQHHRERPKQDQKNWDC